MRVLEKIKELEGSKEFKDWRKSHSEAYLAHCFKMLDKANENIWQIGYFSPKTNLITVFAVDKAITRNNDEEVFKEQKKVVQKLDVLKVKTDEVSALNAAKKILDDNYKGAIVFKSFMILQNIDKIGQVWNVTFVTGQFKTINIKIDSSSNECISHKEVSLIQKSD